MSFMSKLAKIRVAHNAWNAYRSRRYLVGGGKILVRGSASTIRAMLASRPIRQAAGFYGRSAASHAFYAVNRYRHVGGTQLGHAFRGNQYVKLGRRAGRSR